MELIKLAAAAILKRATRVGFGPPDSTWEQFIAPMRRYNNPYDIDPNRLPTAYGQVNPHSHRYRWQDELPLKYFFERPGAQGRNMNLQYTGPQPELLNNIEAANARRSNIIAKRAKELLSSLSL